MTKTDKITIQAVLRYWQFKDRLKQLSVEKGKAEAVRQVQRLRELQSGKDKHILN